MKVLSDVFKVIAALPRVITKPALASMWLRSAIVPIVALLIFAALVPTILFRALDRMVDRAYRPVTVKGGFLGLSSKTVDNPEATRTRERGRIALISIPAGLVGLLFLRRLGRTLDEAEIISKGSEIVALSSVDHASALKRLNESLSLTLDPERTVTLIERIKVLTVDPSPTVTIPPKPSAEGTSIIGPTALGRYTITRTLGKGAMGVVHLAHDNTLKRDVAMKELHENLAHDRELVERFRSEALVLARMAHPGIVQVYDFIEESGRAMIVMEFVKGRELAEVLKERGQLSPTDSVTIASSMAEALGYAHASGVVHRDFKPSNVIIPETGPKIMDFGLAKIAEAAHHTMAGTILGSPAYMSPEQAEGKPADARSDIYSLGIVLYRMLTGRLPFEGDLRSILSAHITTVPPSPRSIDPAIPEFLDKLVMTMLAKNPDERPQNMQSVVTALRAG